MAFMSNPNSGGDFKVYVKYNAKAGRWYTKKDEKDAPEFEVSDLTAIFDMDNLKTGWIMFPPNAAPQKHWDPSLSEELPCPGEGYKRGFQLDLYSEKNLLGVREFCSTAGVVIDAMNALHTDWEVGKAANPGKVPVVKCNGVVELKNKHGSNYEPQLSIIKWVDRPADLAGDAAPAKAAVPAAKTEHAPPPAAKAPAPATADDDIEF